MEAQALFDMKNDDSPLELIYSANENMMSGEALGEAIVGMSTMLKIAAHTAGIDFVDVHVYAAEQGSILTPFALVKRTRGRTELTPFGATVAGGLVVISVQLIAEHGIAALKNPEKSVMQTVDKRVLDLCMNSEYRKSVGKVARPLNQDNEKVVIKSGDFSCEITRENQYKYLTKDEEPILSELRAGQTVRLPGLLTRMNLEQNDLGFEYRGRKLKIYPADPEKHVATEFYQFLPTPSVIVSGVVVRQSDFEAPQIRVTSMEVYKSEQTTMFNNTSEESATDSGK